MNAVTKTRASGPAVVPGLAQENDKIWSSIDTKIEHAGTKIVLPGDPTEMSYKAAVETIQRHEAAQNQKYDVTEIVKGAPWDALVAVTRAMQDIYGVVLAQSIHTFFGEIKPDLVTIVTGHRDEDRIQVPMGRMQLPNVSEPVTVVMQADGAHIIGSVRPADRAILVDIATRARAFMRTASVYKAKAIRLKVDNEGKLGLGEQPEFIDLSAVAETDMIHTPETEALIRANVFGPLKNTQACRDHRIPLKRGILLEGRYGTGKSLTARVTAKVANENGWTFIMLDRSQGLRAAIEFARTYQPCVIFAEDIDRAADREDESVNDLVNLIDGVISKDMEMMTILTTNFIEKIDKALLRPGRFDAVISIEPPDAGTVVRLIYQYARGLLAEGDLTRVGEVLAGQIPATIREVVERAKLSMLVESRDKITPDDLYVSAVGMKRHLDLLADKPAEKSPGDRLAEAFTDVLFGFDGSGSSAGLEEVKERINSTRVLIRDHVLAARKEIAQVKEIAASGAGAAEATNKRTEAMAETLESVSDRI